MIIDWLLNLISDKLKKKFTGTIKINAFQGGITNVIIEESIKPPA